MMMVAARVLAMLVDFVMIHCYHFSDGIWQYGVMVMMMMVVGE